MRKTYANKIYLKQCPRIVSLTRHLVSDTIVQLKLDEKALRVLSGSLQD